VFNIYTSPTPSGAHCDKCGDHPQLIQRPDDKEEVIGKRLEVYEAQTKPLIKYYEAAGLLRVVEADADVDTVFKSIQRAVQPA
jgi:adenylate kinase